MSVQTAIKCLRFGFVFFWHANGSLITKIKSTVRFLPIYYLHSRRQMDCISRNLEELDRKKRSAPSASAEQYKATLNHYF